MDGWMLLGRYWKDRHTVTWMFGRYHCGGISSQTRATGSRDHVAHIGRRGRVRLGCEVRKCGKVRPGPLWF